LNVPLSVLMILRNKGSSGFIERACFLLLVVV
jgi:hypothetical protein